MGGSKGGGSSVKIPKPPPINQSYTSGVNLQLGSLPNQVNTEDATRAAQDPARVAAQQQLQGQFGPTQYGQQIQALSQLDPAWLTAHNATGTQVTNQLRMGSQLDPASMNQLQQSVRGAQAARGNIYGDSAGQAEAYTLGNAGQQLYQQRLANAQGFLQTPTVPSQINQVAPVQPDRSFSYVDPAAGFEGLNAANARYQGIVGAAAANNSGQQNSWLSTLGDVAKIAGTVASFA